MSARSVSPATIPEALVRAARGGPGLVFHLEEGTERLSAADLHRSADRGANALQALGVRSGDAVGILGPNAPEWARWAFAVWRVGAAVVPIGFHLRIRDWGALTEQLRRIVGVAGCRIVLAERSLARAVPRQLAVPWDGPWSDTGRETAEGPGPTPEDVAVLQFTSGSTAAPKGVVLTHAAVLASMAASKQQMNVRRGVDRYLAWLPFFHDNGLFGYLLRPVIHGCEGHVLPTARFARDPVSWFRLLAEIGATITSGPSSAWAAVVRAAERERPDIDLSALRMAIIAAEMIDPAVVDRLVDLGPRWGLRVSAIAGGYGMAEATLGVSLTLPGRGLRIERVGLKQLAGGQAMAAGGSLQKRIASCGRPLPGFEVLIGSPADPLDEREVGEVLLKGPSLMRGYLGGDDEDPFVDGWFRTGDLGYLAEGELFLTGRTKDVIIAWGRNYAPEDIEWAAGRVPGVRSGRCVAFGPTGGREGEVVVVVEARPEADPASLPSLVRAAVTDAVGLVPKDVLVVPNGTVPKTTSGKLRRSALRTAHADGSLLGAAIARLR